MKEKKFKKVMKKVGRFARNLLINMAGIVIFVGIINRL